MLAAFKEYNAIKVEYRGEDITKEIINQIVKHGILPDGKEVIYYDKYTDEHISSRNFKYMNAWTILYKIDPEVMAEYLDSLEDWQKEYTSASIEEYRKLAEEEENKNIIEV